MTAKQRTRNRSVSNMFPGASISTIIWLAYTKDVPKLNNTRSLDDVAYDVCDAFAITTSSLIAKKRTHIAVAARQIFCYAARKMTINTFQDIGRYLQQHHSTIIYSNRNVMELLQVSDSDFAKYWSIYIKNTKLFKGKIRKHYA